MIFFKEVFIIESKRPIGFASWGEDCKDNKNQEKNENLVENYDDKFCEYDGMLMKLIEEATKNRSLFLKENRKRILLEMQVIDLENEVKKFKKKIKKLKAKD